MFHLHLHCRYIHTLHTRAWYRHTYRHNLTMHFAPRHTDRCYHSKASSCWRATVTRLPGYLLENKLPPEYFLLLTHYESFGQKGVTWTLTENEVSFERISWRQPRRLEMSIICTYCTRRNLRTFDPSTTLIHNPLFQFWGYIANTPR